VVHIQCHIGFDSIALARRGARVTGVDFSRTALAKAADLAERCGVEIEWVQADATALPDRLSGGFDLAYATIGAICWIEDIGAWMRCAAATLRPGGRLVLVEISPALTRTEAAVPVRMEGGSGGATAAFHKCRGEVGAGRAPAGGRLVVVRSGTAPRGAI
jgi:SAM-dependent methyltransferase